MTEERSQRNDLVETHGMRLGVEEMRAEIKLVEIIIPDICRDSDDNNILALADVCQADFIITGDKDLLVLSDYLGTKIVSPGNFFNQ